VETLYLIVGLGNPGTEYAETRHNAGFQVVARLARRWKAAWSREKGLKSRLALAELAGRRVLLCQPQTYMNSSGEAVASVAGYFQVPLPQMLVVVDDADLPFGELRLRGSGSSGGHRGLESMEQHLATRAYARLRLGIGRSATDEREIRDYVLSRFTQAEAELWERVLRRAADQAECWLTAGLELAMTRFNGAINTTKEQQ
jgi:PTH1 family peptidyl-tRNA hydrolase